MSEEPETNSDIRALVDELWNERVYGLLKVKPDTPPSDVHLSIIQPNLESRKIKRTKLIRKDQLQGSRKDKPKSKGHMNSES